MKKRSLAESGPAGGADFWLKEGESVNVAGTDQVFALISDYHGTATVNLGGTRKRLAPGDQMTAESGGGSCTVFFKMGVTPDPAHLGRGNQDPYPCSDLEPWTWAGTGTPEPEAR